MKNLTGHQRYLTDSGPCGKSCHSRTQLTAEFQSNHWVTEVARVSVWKKIKMKKTSLYLMLTEMLVLLWIKFFCLMYNTKNLYLYCYAFLLLLASFPSYGISFFNLGTQETVKEGTWSV